MVAQPPRAGVLLFDQVEVLDFAGPLEVLGRARTPQDGPCFEVTTLAPTQEISCVDGLGVRAAYTLERAPELDILVVPGGPGARQPADPAPVVAYLQQQAPRLKLLASVCTGSYWLARAGLLDGLAATTHPQRLADFARAFPRVQVKPRKVVDLGRIITAGGVASGVDLALHLVERYYGWETRRKEAIRLDGPWR